MKDDVLTEEELSILEYSGLLLNEIEEMKNYKEEDRKDMMRMVVVMMWRKEKDLLTDSEGYCYYCYYCYYYCRS